MASAGRAPLPEVLPPSRRTGVATPEFGPVTALDDVNHADEDGRFSTSYSPLSTVAPEAVTCDIDLPPLHVSEHQEYDITNMTRERGQEDDVIDSGHGADGEEIQQVWLLPGSLRLSLTTISACMCIVHYSTLSCQKLDQEVKIRCFSPMNNLRMTY